MGKAYANRKKKSERPTNDFYPTPRCMVRELLDANDEFLGGRIFTERNDSDRILDPCCGKYAIGNTIRNHNENLSHLNIIERDLIYGDDFLPRDENKKVILGDEHYDAIIMNPPFSLFDDFVEKSKRIADRVYCIGKINFFGAHDRNVNGLWEHLEWVLPFDRQIAFDKAEHEDGTVEMGMLVSCWFIWDKYYHGYPKIKPLDMQKYAYHKPRNKSKNKS